MYISIIYINYVIITLVRHVYFYYIHFILLDIQGRIQADATDALASVKKYASTVFGQLVVSR